MQIEAVSSRMILFRNAPALAETADVQAVQGSDLESTVVVAMSTSTCYSFFKSSNDAKRLAKREVLLYELEDEIPVDADDLAVDRIDTKAGTLIAAADGRSASSFIEELEENGHFVSCITPMIFLALADLARRHSIKATDVVAWRSPEGIDVVRLHRGQPIDWRWVDGESGSLDPLLNSLGWVDDKSRVLLLNISPSEPTDELSAARVIELDRQQCAATESDRIARGRARPWIDLRNGPLAPSDPLRSIASSLRFFAVAALVLQLSVIAGALLVATTYRSESSKLVEKQEVAFQDVFPGRSIPVGIVSRLQSEHRRLSGTRGLTDQAVPKLVSAIPVSHRLLAALPKRDDARYAINRIEFSPSTVVRASGVAKSYGDLELIAERLRRSGMSVPAVSANKVSGGVSLQFENLALDEDVKLP